MRSRQTILFRRQKIAANGAEVIVHGKVSTITRESERDDAAKERE